MSASAISSPSVRDPGNFRKGIVFYTIFRRETMRYLKIAVQTLIAPFLSQILFLAVFGGAYGARTFGDGSVPFLRFLIPGLVFSGAVLSAFQNPVFSLIGMKYQGTLKEYCLYPITAMTRLAAFALSGAVRGVLVGAMIYAASGFFGGFEIGNPYLFWAYIALISFLAAAAGVAAGFQVETFDQANFIVGLIVTPAMYLSGVYYDYRAAGDVLAGIARFNPLTALVAAGRAFYLDLPFRPEAAGILITAAFLASLGAWTLITIIAEKGLKTE